jgi:hypothetical protein
VLSGPAAVVGTRAVATRTALLTHTAQAVGVDGVGQLGIVVNGRHHHVLSVMS